MRKEENKGMGKLGTERHCFTDVRKMKRTEKYTKDSTSSQTCFNGRNGGIKRNSYAMDIDRERRCFKCEAFGHIVYYYRNQEVMRYHISLHHSVLQPQIMLIFSFTLSKHFQYRLLLSIFSQMFLLVFCQTPWTPFLIPKDYQ